MRKSTIKILMKEPKTEDDYLISTYVKIPKKISTIDQRTIDQHKMMEYFMNHLGKLTLSRSSQLDCIQKTGNYNKTYDEWNIHLSKVSPPDSHNINPVQFNQNLKRDFLPCIVNVIVAYIIPDVFSLK